MSSAAAPTPIDDLAAIVLVGGRSSRMGRPKPWLDLGGRPLLTRVVADVRLWVREIVLVAAQDQDLPPLDDGVTPPPRVVHDDLPGAGPLPALARGLASIAAPWALALACDAPLVRMSVVARLAAERGADVDAVVPTWEGRLQPLLALYRRELGARLAACVAEGERRLHIIGDWPRVRRVPSDALAVLDPEGESFESVNTPAEFARVAALWEKRRRPTR